MPAIATETEVGQAISDFADLLCHKIRLDALILFGSYADGEPHEWSDIDVAVVSSDFEGMPMSERQSMLASVTWQRADLRIEPIGYASSEYRALGKHSFLAEIIRTGRVVYEAPGE